MIWQTNARGRPRGGYTNSHLDILGKISGMATSSTIGIRNEDGTVTAIYCHWGGYIDYNGMILKDHYTTTDKIRELISLGSISRLGPEVGEKQDFDKPTNKNWCLVSGRDRGETDTEAKTYASIQQWQKHGEEYDYLWDGSEWLVTGGVTKDELRSLVQVMLERSKDHD